MVSGPASEWARPQLSLVVMTDPKKSLTILLAGPHSFCAGVERAIERYGRPIYVRDEIVHNRFVTESLEAKGAIFVDELEQVPGDRPAVFCAHGVVEDVRTTDESVVFKLPRQLVA